MSRTRCVLLWAKPGAGDALIGYEGQIVDWFSRLFG